MKNILCRILVLSIALLIAGRAAEAAQQSGAPSGAYTVCFATNPGAQYFSAAFPSAPQPSGEDRAKWVAAFVKFVEQKYSVQISGNESCTQYGTQAAADAALKRASTPQLKIVNTEWTPSMAAATSAAPEPAGMWAICSSDANRSPVYYSGDIHVDVDIVKQTEKGAQDPRVVELTQQYQKQFLAFLQSKYAFAPSGAFPTTCQFNMKGAPEIAALKARMSSRFPSMKFVETGWLPGTPIPKASAPAAASGGPAAAIAGVYTGTYICGGRTRSLKLTITGPENGLVTAHFTAYYPPEARDKAYTFTSNGHLDPASGKFTLNPLKWDTAEPPNVMMVGMTGTFDPTANKVTGKIDYPGCTTFEAMRGRDD